MRRLNQSHAPISVPRPAEPLFERCANCGRVDALRTGYVRIRDEAFVCGRCVTVATGEKST